jgi:TolB-like protein
MTVFEFEAIGVSESEAREYTDFFSDRLDQTGRYRIIGRDERDARVEKSGSQESQRATAKALGIDYMVQGRLKRGEKGYLLSLCVIGVASGKTIYWTERNYAGLSDLYDDAALLAQEIASNRAVLPREENGIGGNRQKREKDSAADFRRPNFRSELQQLVSKSNPAALAIQNGDLKIRFEQSGSWQARDTVPGDDYAGNPKRAESAVGAELPLGRRLGFGCWSRFLFENTALAATHTFDYLGMPSTAFEPRIYDLSVKAGLGYRLSRTVAAGTTIHFGNRWEEQHNGSATISSDSSRYFGFDVGILWEDWQERFVLDLHGAYTSQEQTYIDGSDLRVKVDSHPLSLKGSLTSALLWPVYLSLGVGADVYAAARSDHVLTALAVIHPWIADILRFRAGYIYTHSCMDRELTAGHGFLAGFSFLEEVVDGFRLHVEYVLRPSHLPVVPARIMYEHFLFAGVALGILM